MKITFTPKTRNTRFLLSLILVLLLTTSSKAQLKVAQYSFGKYGTEKYEHFEFLTQGGKRTAIIYSYGSPQKETKLYYVGTSRINGDTCFKVRFANAYTLYVIPKELQLRITDSAGKYDKTFSWQYEGPVNGIGTHCETCAENETDALNMIQSSYLK